MRDLSAVSRVRSGGGPNSRTARAPCCGVGSPSRRWPSSWTRLPHPRRGGGWLAASRCRSARATPMGAGRNARGQPAPAGGRPLVETARACDAGRVVTTPPTSVACPHFPLALTAPPPDQSGRKSRAAAAAPYGRALRQLVSRGTHFQARRLLPGSAAGRGLARPDRPRPRRRRRVDPSGRRDRGCSRSPGRRERGARP
jgi:hypothetical protein